MFTTLLPSNGHVSLFWLSAILSQFFLVVILHGSALHQLPDTNRKEGLIAEPSVLSILILKFS
jgi:hypothetical protein